MTPVVAHTSWTGKDGAPQDVSALAQTTDGFLWLGTPFGLFRFDGIEFVRYPTTPLTSPLPSTDIEALSSDDKGGLWIGYRSGGISHLFADGTLKNYNPQNHLGPTSAQKFVVRPDGYVWALADYRLYRLENDHWENVGPKLGLPSEPLFCLFFDKAGTIWMSTRKALFDLRRGRPTFETFPTQTFMVADMAETPDGELWIVDAWHTIRPLIPSKGHPGWRVFGYVRMVAEKSGTLWLAQDYQGVTHMPWAKQQPALVKEGELSSEQTNAILLDRGGDIWVGTSRGLDRFRSTPMTKLSQVKVEYYPALSADPHHGVWIGSLGHPIAYASNGKVTPVGRVVGSSPMVCDDHGVVWMVDPIKNMLTKWDGPKMSQIAIPDDAHQAPAESLGLDRDGGLLVSFKSNGLWKYDGSWNRITDPNLPQDDPLSIVRDKDNRVWFGYANSIIAVHDEGGYHMFTPNQSGDLGNVLTFGMEGGLVWAGGTNGIAYLNGHTFHRVSFARDNSVTGISGLAEDEAGNLWLNSSTGIVRISKQQLSDLAHTQNQLEYELYDDREGVTGTATQLKPTPSVAVDRDGPLWFSVSGQVLSLSPNAIAPPQSIPSVIIERTLMNGIPVSDREHPLNNISLESSHLKELEIDYAGIDMAAPEKISYQYTMEGEDKTWHIVGNRRQAFYNHLSPGRYRFRLKVASGNSAWTELTIPLWITVTPAFYQTSWFIAAVVILVIGALYLLYILRVRYLTSSLKRRLKMRSDERLRIARELHDTLLQSIHGLMLRFHFATEELPKGEPARQPLLLALQRADDVFMEARQRIELLRDEVPDEPDFALQLTKVAEELALQKVMNFRVIEEGQSRFLKGDVQNELCRIAREALVNTAHHGKARSAEICLVYERSGLTMKCCDDGIGIPPEVLRDGKRFGHWGLIGMKERAATIEARYQLWSAPGAGTQIEVRVPAKRAYRFPDSNARWFEELRQFRQSATGQDPHGE